MQGYNCIIVIHKNGRDLLFCERKKPPYQGLYNLVGGKIEPEEDGYEAAYRELEEETGISRDQITLSHMMDFTYYNQDCYVEVYVGNLTSEVELQEEIHPLLWMDESEDFFDMNRFAGEGNIGHMIEQIKCFGRGVFQEKEEEKQAILLNTEGIYIGVDGCKGGWIAAVLDDGELRIEKHNSLEQIVANNPDFDEFLVDMVIGLPGNREHVRPDTYARKIIKERASTIFPAPCRQAVYATTVADAYTENEKVLGKKFTPLTVGIMPKMLEVDMYLRENHHLKNRIRESHPEVCFARLQGNTVCSKKSEIDGMEERIQILSRYIKIQSLKELSETARALKCNVDDIIDAICLAIVGNLITQGKYEVIPNEPMTDDMGLFMQMVIPLI